MYTTDSIDTLSTASIKRTMHTALHEHELHQVNPLEVYGAYGGHWKCDNCSAESNATQYPFHCRRCSFDLCNSCAQTNVQHDTLAHQHPLFYVETSRLIYQNQNGLWKCQVCKKTSSELRETFSYHCPTCNDFDICRSCFEPRRHPIHIHVLGLVDTTLLYPESRGNWVCDICGYQSRPWEKFAYHCSECSNFDVCPDCYKPLMTPLHSHPLYKASPHYVYAQFHGGWQCDNCGSAFNNPTLQSYPWHCSLCSYDLCQNCVGNESVDQTGPPPQHFGRTRSFQTPAAPGFSFNRQPAENPWVTRNRLSPSSDDDVPQTFTTERGNAVAFPEDTDDNSKCIICMEQPKNATVIHGDTGHCCCCWACAQVLKQRGDPCPICRAPIDHVIRQFNA